MTKRMKRIFAFLCAFALLVSTVLGTGIIKGAKAADTEPTPVTLEGFDTLSIGDFVDEQGNPMAAGEYAGASTGAHNVFSATGLTNLDKKLLSLKITFKGGDYKHSLIFGGNGGWCGFNLHPNGDGSALIIDESWAGEITNKDAYEPLSMSAATAGVDSFINNEFILQMSLEYGEVVDGKADLTIGVYINGKLYNDQTFTIADCNMSATGNVLALYREVDGSGIIVKSFNDTVIKPAEVEGFQTISIEDFSNSEGTMQAGTYQGAAGGAHKDYSAANLTNFDKALLSMKVTYTAGSYKTRLDIGGNAGWTGFSVHPSGDGSTLQIRDNYGMTDMADDKLPTLSAATAGLTSFINNELILQMSFEYSGTDLTLGVYINGKLYNNQKFTITECNTSKVGSHLAFYGEDVNGGVILNSINETEEPENPDTPVVPDTPTEFTDVTIKDFVDASGAQMQERAYGNTEVSGTLDAFKLKNGDTLDGKMLSMKVKFEGGGGNTRIDVAGSQDWTGFSVYASKTSNYLHIYTNYNFASPAQGFDIDMSQAGLSSILEQEILLQMGIDYVEADNNLKISVYVNEKDCGTYTINNCDLSKFGGYIGLYRQDMDSVITVGSYPEQVVETPSEDLEEVTYTDFGIKEKVYKYVSGDLAVQGTLSDRSSLAGTIAGGDIELTGEGEYQIILGGIGNGWDGLRMLVKDERIHTYWYQGAAGTFIKTLYPATADVDFVGSKFNLKVSMELVDNDEDGQVNDIKVGYWFDDVLYENSYEIISNAGNQLGNKFGVYCEKENDTVTLGTPSEDGGEEDDDTPKQPNANLSSYTFADFGIKDKVYKSVSGDFAAQGTLKGKDSLAETIVGGDILLEGEGEYQIVFGGKDNTWDGLRLMVKNDRIHTYWFNSNGGTFIKTLAQTTAGVNFIGEKFNLKVSTELIDDLGDGKKNDLQIGIWFNDVLYGNEYLLITNHGEEMGNRLGVYCEKEGDTATIGTPSADADKPIQPDESFEKLTFAHFGIKDAEYPYNGDIVVQGTMDSKENINKTVICGNILMTAGGDYQLLFGSKENIWDGLRLIANDKSIHVYWYQGHVGTYIKSLSPAVAGVDFTGKEFNLMLSTELVDYDGDGKKNDTKFGIWFNGVLYENDFIILQNHGKELGNMVGAYCATEGTSVTLNSIAELAPEPEPLKQPNKDFKKITFSHFSAEDGTYKYDGTTATTFEGKADISLDRTILCGDLRLNGIGDTHLMLGGVTNVWYGYRFVLLTNGNLALYWIDEDGMYLLEIFDPVTAGTQLVDTWFNIMISNEIVDADDDGDADDLELGVWFNEVLYKNKYLTVLNEAKDFGKYFGFDCATEGTAVSIKSIPELVEGFNYAKFGLTEDWEDTLLKTGLKAGLAVGGSKEPEPFTGDWFDERKVYFYGFAAIAALVAGIYVALQRKKES